MEKPTKKRVRAHVKAGPAPTFNLDDLVGIIDHAVQSAMRPANLATAAVERYVDEKTACTASVSPLTRAIDALAGLHHLEARVHTLMADVVGMPSDGAGQTADKDPSPCGVFNVLGLAADDAFARTDRIHHMLGNIERALP